MKKLNKVPGQNLDNNWFNPTINEDGKVSSGNIYLEILEDQINTKEN